MGDRNVEIWSTRLQREILALESSDDDSKKMELLPPFIKTASHTLNIEGGIAKIEFRIDVELGDDTAGVNSEGAPSETSGEEEVAEKNAEAETATATDAKEEDKSAEKADEAADDKKEEVTETEGDKTEETNDEGKQDEDAKTESDSKEETKSENEDAQEEKEAIDPHVILVLDASLYWKPDSSTQNNNPQCYPFQKPLAIIRSGAGWFSGGSTIENGDEVDIDLDWTPSIHLSDAVTNVALKIRECVKRGEPLHPSKREDVDDDEGLSGSILREAKEAKEAMLETKKAMGAMFSSGFSSLSAKGSSFAAKAKTESKSVSKGFMSLGESLSASLAEASAIVAPEGEAEGEAEQKEVTAKKVVKEVPDIGDEIDLSEEPWIKCIGMYSCKAIKRPAFVEEAIAKGKKPEKNEVRRINVIRIGSNMNPSQHFNPLFHRQTSTASSMFSRFAQSAKSAMEESFIMITEKAIIEFRSSKLNIGSGTGKIPFGLKPIFPLIFPTKPQLSSSSDLLT